MNDHGPINGTTSTDVLLTIDQLAARWQVDPSTVRKWIKAGLLPVVRLGPRVTRISQTLAVDFEAHQIRWTITSDQES